jgi:hypothetical protein
MNRSCTELLLVLPFMCTPAFAQAQRSVPVRWEWWVVSTPDFLGPFRGGEPGFKAPVPKHSLPRTLALAREERVLGQFEVIVTLAGGTVLEKTLSVSGPEVERRTKDALRRWRLTPALLDGKPIRVRLRVMILEGANTPQEPPAERRGGSAAIR